MDFVLTAKQTKARDMGVTALDPLEINERIQLTSGTGAGKADLLWYDERTLAASGDEELDLVGNLANAFGDTFSPVRIKALWFKAAPRSGVANTNNVILGAAAATQWAALLGTTGTITFRPGARMMFAADPADATGYVCAAGATDKLKVANSGAGTEVVYQIAVIGVSA
jgi:hypothetical protein